MSKYFPPSHKSLEKHSLKFVSSKNNRLKKNLPQLPGMLAFHFPIQRLKRNSPSLFPPLIPCMFSPDPFSPNFFSSRDDKRGVVAVGSVGGYRALRTHRRRREAQWNLNDSRNPEHRPPQFGLFCSHSEKGVWVSSLPSSLMRHHTSSF